MYDFSDPNGPQLGTVALPPSDVVTKAIDPVALISTCAALGLKVIDDLETVVVIDRGDRLFSQGKFYAFRTPENNVLVQWSDRVEPGFEVLGKVILCTVPWAEGLRSPKSGFVEDDEEDDE